MEQQRKRSCREEGTRVASDSQGVGRGQRFFQNKSKFGANIRPFRMFISAWEKVPLWFFRVSWNAKMQYFESWLHVQRQASRRVEETRRPELAREVEGQVCRGLLDPSKAWARERIVAVVM